MRVRQEGTWPATKEVWGSNYCDIGFAVDERTGRITIVSVIDNLVKGAAGQAIQNLNLMMGWDETLGSDSYRFILKIAIDTQKKEKRLNMGQGNAIRIIHGRTERLGHDAQRL